MATFKDAFIPDELVSAQEFLWLNPNLGPAEECLAKAELSVADVDDAEARLIRFAPLIAQLFPETAAAQGIIESPVTPLPVFAERALEGAGEAVALIDPANVLLKRDDSLPVSGSVKARGGIYEVLKHAEDLALEAGLLDSLEDDYTKLLSPEARELFSQHIIQVGSTGNLGLSIGIMGSALGFRAIIHMSADAWQWKKDLLRSRGAEVMEYEGDYGAAVAEGRALSDANPASYFVDDETSQALFLGYAVSARRLQRQLEDAGMPIGPDRPLFAYLPCGVGGAPGGIAFGLKQVFGDNVHCFFVEPVQAPCMTLGLASGLHSEICVQDIGLTGSTTADGLAVGRPSAFVGRTIEGLISGCFTVSDESIAALTHHLWDTEGIFIEPSAASSLVFAERVSEFAEYLAKVPNARNACHLAWATGGNMVPDAERASLLE